MVSQIEDILKIDKVLAKRYGMNRDRLLSICRAANILLDWNPGGARRDYRVSIRALERQLLNCIAATPVEGSDRPDRSAVLASVDPSVIDDLRCGPLARRPGRRSKRG